jgi:hypothetical protein
MSEPSPEDPAWLQTLVEGTPLLPDPGLREHWTRVIPWLPIAARYELAATLREVEHHLALTPTLSQREREHG